MTEDSRKHLEFIQNVITRMNTNSFAIKGWAVTLVSALFALAAKDSDHRFVVVAYFPIIMFWLLDGFYLSQERQYRKLYDQVRKSEGGEYSMNASAFDTGWDSWPGAALSITLLVFYVSMLGVVTFVLLFLRSQTPAKLF